MTEREIKFNEWREKVSFPNISDSIKQQKAISFIRMIEENSLPKPLYKHQQLSILNVIYSYEVERDLDVLLDVVTGGGKTVIMSALVSYFWQVHEIEKFLILTPNTIVRERVKDDFDIKSPDYAYDSFPFFFNGHKNVPKTLVSKVLREKGDTNSIKDAHIIIANIHQLYEGKDSLNVLLDDTNTSDIILFNDEAHNAGAMQYKEVLKLLKRKVRMRIDLTATPFRLDGEELDTYPPIYSYQVIQATKDRIVKQTLVTRPDISRVKMTYEEWDDEKNIIRTLSAEEMDWEQIESELKKSGSVKFVTAKNARRQQLQIAEACMDFQRKGVPNDQHGKKAWEPIMLIVALSQLDAREIHKTLLESSVFNYKSEEVLLVHSKQDELQNKVAFLMGRSSPEGLSKEDVELWHQAKRVKIVIGVGMLREGWDVRNISVICLFRKFSYTKKGDQIYTVYGPQIIGRGLRKINRGKQIDNLFVVDHPVFSHDWLWKMMGSEIYNGPINPGEEIDNSIVEEINKNSENPSDNQEEKDNEENQKDTEKTLEDLLKSIPETGDLDVILDWQKHFIEMEFTRGKIANAMQHITGIKTNIVGTENTSHEIPDNLINTPDELNKGYENVEKTLEEKIIAIKSDLENLSRQTLQSNFKQVSAENLTKIQSALGWLLKEKFEIENLNYLENEDDVKVNKLYFSLAAIIGEFYRPEIILGIIDEK